VMVYRQCPLLVGSLMNEQGLSFYLLGTLPLRVGSGDANTV